MGNGVIRRILISSLILLLYFSAFAGTTLIDETRANPDAPTMLAMPQEQINYTISEINGNLWAKIDGRYPIKVLTEEDGAPSCLPAELPMVYPTPPGTINIHLRVDKTDLEWSSYPQITHHTAIGDWSMIYCQVNPVPKQFVLKIHYEHPLEQVNGSYIFLYDLNIGPYLSPWSPNSTAYFNIQFDANITELQAFTTERDEIWNSINYTINKEARTQIILLQIYSEYSEPLLGDLVILFSDNETQDPSPTGALPMEYVYVAVAAVVIGVVVIGIVVYKKRK
jgi:hypothetical protein